VVDQEHTLKKGAAVGKKYQNDQCETSVPAVPEQVSVALDELVGEVREGLLALAVGTGLQVLTG
jgi:hypothetical protein